MALGKLWNALFGKRATVEGDSANAGTGQSQTQRTGTGASPQRSTAPAAVRTGKADAAAAPDQARLSVVGESRQAESTGAAKVKKKSQGKRSKKPAPVAQVAATPVEPTPPQRTVRIASPKKNAWTKLISGRQIHSILDTQLGDGSRAIEVLEAIVCDAAPVPKYIAIDLFELGSGPLKLAEFHQRVRRVGGQAVAIPADLIAGLRQLSQTLGTVDLVLLSGNGVDLTRLEVRRLLSRITHQDSLVLHQDERGKWHSVEAIGPARQRPAETKAKAA